MRKSESNGCSLFPSEEELTIVLIKNLVISVAYSNILFHLYNLYISIYLIVLSQVLRLLDICIL